MYGVISRLIIFTILSVMSVPIVMAGYGAYVLAIALGGLSVYIVHLNEVNIIPLILCVPIVLIAIGGYAAYVGYLLALVLLSIGGFVVYVLYFTDWRARPLTYQQLRSRLYPGDEMTNHFPIEIPNDARDFDMYYASGPSGYFSWEVRMKLPPAQIKEIQDRFRLAAKLKYIPGRDDNSIDKEYNLDSRLRLSDYGFYWDEIEGRSFPEHYELLVLEDTSGRDINKSCNYGVAIDFLASEVFYWTRQIS